MMKKTAATLLTLPLACALANAAPEVYSNFDLNYDIGLFLPEFRFSSEAAPLEIMLPAASQAPLDFMGSVPENAVALQYRSHQASFDIGWKSIGGDPVTMFDSNVSIIDGPTNTVHWEADPKITSDFVSPKIFQPGDAVGPGQPSSRLLYLAASPTQKFGFYDYWFVPSRFIVGVAIQETDGVHYGFIEFEDVSQLPMIRDYQPVRWGYETEPDTAFVIPQDCGIADMNRDNTLNFFDVSVYLSAYADNRFAADLNLDGQVNFFDVSLFLSNYNAGCP